MKNTLGVGKVPSDVLEKLLARAPVDDPRVLLGPGIGLDCAVVDAGENLLVFKSDPITFTTDEIGNYLVQINANDIATTIQESGYRLWGNRTTSADPKYAFLNVRRTADMINESLLRAHLWAVDRNITKTYIEDVVGGVNEYLRSLQARGAILGGSAWADPELNTETALQNGEVYIDFDFTPPYPAEHITFRSHLVNDYLSEVVSDA